MNTVDERSLSYRWMLARLERAQQKQDTISVIELRRSIQQFEANNREFVLLDAATALDEAAEACKSGDGGDLYRLAVARVRRALAAMPQFPEVQP